MTLLSDLINEEIATRKHRGPQCTVGQLVKSLAPKECKELEDYLADRDVPHAVLLEVTNKISKQKKAKGEPDWELWALKPHPVRRHRQGAWGEALDPCRCFRDV